MRPERVSLSEETQDRLVPYFLQWALYFRSDFRRPFFRKVSASVGVSRGKTTVVWENKCVQLREINVYKCVPKLKEKMYRGAHRIPCLCCERATAGSQCRGKSVNAAKFRPPNRGERNRVAVSAFSERTCPAAPATPSCRFAAFFVFLPHILYFSFSYSAAVMCQKWIIHRKYSL